MLGDRFYRLARLVAIYFAARNATADAAAAYPENNPDERLENWNSNT
jgi:hypothetical protein